MLFRQSRFVASSQICGGTASFVYFGPYFGACPHGGSWAGWWHSHRVHFLPIVSLGEEFLIPVLCCFADVQSNFVYNKRPSVVEALLCRSQDVLLKVGTQWRFLHLFLCSLGCAGVSALKTLSSDSSRVGTRAGFSLNSFLLNVSGTMLNNCFTKDWDAH